MRAQILELKHKLFQTTKLPSDYQRLLQYFCKSCQLQFLWNENETTGHRPLHFVKWIIERLRVNGPLIREERLLSLPPPPPAAIPSLPTSGYPNQALIKPLLSTTSCFYNCNQRRAPPPRHKPPHRSYPVLTYDKALQNSLLSGRISIDIWNCVWYCQSWIGAVSTCEC